MGKGNVMDPYSRILFSNEKEYSIDTHGWTLKTLRPVKEASHRRLPILWFPYKKYRDYAKPRKQKVVCWLPRSQMVGRKSGESANGHSVSMWGDGDVLELVVMVAQFCK